MPCSIMNGDLPSGTAAGPIGSARLEGRDAMNIEQLHGRAVVSVQQAEKLGSIDDVLVDLQQHRLAGLVLRGGLFRGGPTIDWSEVRTVGQDAVMVDTNAAAREAHNQGELANMPKFGSVRGTKVVTDAGELAGTISGLDIDQQTGAVTNYIVAAPTTGLFRTAPHYLVPPHAVKAVGKDLMTVDAQVVDFQREPSL